MDRKSRSKKNSYLRLIERYFQLMTSKQMDLLLECFEEDAVMFFPAANIHVKGREAVRKVFAKFFADYPIHKVTLKHIAVDGTFGATEQHVTLVDRDGRKTEFPDNANHFHFVGEKIARIRIYSDYSEGQPLSQGFKTSPE